MSIVRGGNGRDEWFVLSLVDGKKKRLLVPLEGWPEDERQAFINAVRSFTTFEPPAANDVRDQAKRDHRASIGGGVYALACGLALAVWLSFEAELTLSTAALTAALGLAIGFLMGRLRAGFILLPAAYFGPFAVIASLRSYPAAVPYIGWYLVGLFLGQRLPIRRPQGVNAKRGRARNAA